MNAPDKYNRGWKDCQPEMKARRLDYMLRRLMVVCVASLLAVAAIQAARTIKPSTIHEAGQLPAVASNTPKR